ncbi:uncharacterized protein METZ01_LOCUS423183, partial [marine metagenome]
HLIMLLFPCVAMEVYYWVSVNLSRRGRGGGD